VVGRFGVLLATDGVSGLLHGGVCFLVVVDFVSWWFYG
jgi:hypothetical protein